MGWTSDCGVRRVCKRNALAAASPRATVRPSVANKSGMMTRKYTKDHQGQWRSGYYYKYGCPYSISIYLMPGRPRLRKDVDHRIFQRIHDRLTWFGLASLELTYSIPLIQIFFKIHSLEISYSISVIPLHRMHQKLLYMVFWGLRLFYSTFQLDLYSPSQDVLF